MYTDQGGSLTNPTIFGIDPLSNDDPLMEEREERWNAACGMSVEDIFSKLVSGDDLPLKNAITSFITITENLAQ